jgi:hypothetical protein
VTGVRSELAAAVRAVNAAYARCSEPKPDVIGQTWSELEREVDGAIKDGDRDRALAAIADWEAHASYVLGGGR